MTYIGDWLLGRMAPRLSRIEGMLATVAARQNHLAEMVYQIQRSVEMAGAAEQAALDELKAALDANQSAIDAVKSWADSQDENDASQIAPLIAEARDQQAQLAAMVPQTGPIDAVTGQPVPPAPAEETPPSDE